MEQGRTTALVGRKVKRTFSEFAVRLTLGLQRVRPTARISGFRSGSEGFCGWRAIEEPPSLSTISRKGRATQVIALKRKTDRLRQRSNIRLFANGRKIALLICWLLRSLQSR